MRSAQSCAVSVRPSELAADGRGLEQRIAAPRDRGEVEHRIALERAVVAEELAVRALPAPRGRARRNSLRAHLGVGRHADVVGDALDDRQRRIAQRRDEAELVDRQPHGGGDVVDRMRADDEATGSGLPVAAQAS